jgi:hypothetical protein
MRTPAANHADFCHLAYAPRSGVSLCGSTLCRHADEKPRWFRATDPPTNCWICDREVCSVCLGILAEHRAKRTPATSADGATENETDPWCLRQADLDLERRIEAHEQRGLTSSDA